jgi:hypothetical protein
VGEPAERRKKGKRKASKKVVAAGFDEDDEDESQGSRAGKKAKLGPSDSAQTIDSVGGTEGESPALDDGPMQREDRGSGYPSGELSLPGAANLAVGQWLLCTPTDPKTQAYLKAAFHPVFGYPSIVRFSWAGVKVAIDKDGVPCKWWVSRLRRVARD